MRVFYQKWQSNKLWKVFAGEKGKNLWVYVFLIFLNFFAALLEGGSFGFLFAAFSGLQNNEIPHSSFLKTFFFLKYQGVKLFFLGTVFAVVFQLLRSAVCYVSTIYSTKFALKVQEQFQSEVYNQILNFSYGFITRLKIGDLLEKARAPVHFINPMLESFNRFAVSALTAFVIISIMFFLNVYLALATLCLFCVFGFFQKLIIKTILRASDSFSKHLMETNQDTSQMLQGIKVIQTFFQQEKIKEKIKKRIKEIGKTSKKIYILNNIIPYLNEIISIFVLGIILVFAALLIGLENESFLAVLTTFLIVSFRLSTRVQNAAVALGSTSGYYGHLLRLNEILADKDKEFMPTGGIKIDAPIREIRFESVSFSYYARNEEAIKNISFSIPKQAVIGIVGLSGSGKTSLVDLLLRLYEPTSGKIFANQVDITQFSLKSWRAKFGVVAQDSFLFDESIEENIRFGMDGASSSQILEAAKLAGVDDLIERLPHKLQTIVGERGLRLSGGERQRIALARALLRNPEILILDEATSNLDSQSESYIQSALKRIQKDKTVIIIAHRLSTIIHSDLILVIENGSLIESGTHESLLKNGGRYSNLWELQTERQDELVIQ